MRDLEQQVGTIDTHNLSSDSFRLDMANYLKQRLKELSAHLESPQPSITVAITDLSWSIDHLQ